MRIDDIKEDPPMCLSVGPGGLSDKGRENKLRDFVRNNPKCTKFDVQSFARSIGMTGIQVNFIYQGFGW